MSRLSFKKNTPEWCKAMPKAELHAHLSGSIRSQSIKRLLDRPGHSDIRKRASGLLDADTGRTLKQCFELFPIVHDLITDSETLHELVLEVLDDFAQENTLYLELRTTPRTSENMSDVLYLQTVLDAVHTYHESHPDGLVCRLLVSLCRHQSLDVARNIVKLTEKFLNGSGTRYGDLIVGMELSGNPNRGNWDDFKDLLSDVRQKSKLPISVHFGEILNEEECIKMLDFRPDRIGHAVVLSTKVLNRLLEQYQTLGVEVCLTSNLTTKSVDSVNMHPVVKHFIPEKHPICLCTDDSGIFETTLSDEYGLLVSQTNLTRNEIEAIAVSGFSLAFCELELRSKLIEKAKHMLKMN